MKKYRRKSEVQYSNKNRIINKPKTTNNPKNTAANSVHAGTLACFFLALSSLCAYVCSSKTEKTNWNYDSESHFLHFSLFQKQFSVLLDILCNVILQSCTRTLYSDGYILLIHFQNLGAFRLYPNV